jgi:hypothetical protein
MRPLKLKNETRAVDPTRGVVTGDTGETSTPHPWVRLLPGLDATAMGWKEQSWYLHDAMLDALTDRSGNIGPTVWADGRIVGGWAQRQNGEVALELFGPLRPAHRHLLDEAIGELRAVVGHVVVKPRFPWRNHKRPVS